MHVETGDEEDLIMSTHGERDVARNFAKHSANGLYLTEPEFYSIFASYVDADEATAQRSSQFLFDEFAGSPEAMS